MRNLYAGQEATVRTGHGTTDWFQIGKGIHQVCVLSPCLFNLYAEYIMRSAGLGEAQAAIKISERNINNLESYDQPRWHIKKQRHYFVNKGPCSQGYTLASCLFNLYEECIMQNVKLDEHKLESRLLGEIPITSDMQMTPPL